jgi:hypothetical protein
MPGAHHLLLVWYCELTSLFVAASFSRLLVFEIARFFVPKLMPVGCMYAPPFVLRTASPCRMFEMAILCTS